MPAPIRHRALGPAFAKRLNRDAVVSNLASMRPV